MEETPSTITYSHLLSKNERLKKLKTQEYDIWYVDVIVLARSGKNQQNKS